LCPAKEQGGTVGAAGNGQDDSGARCRQLADLLVQLLFKKHRHKAPQANFATDAALVIQLDLWKITAGRRLESPWATSRASGPNLSSRDGERSCSSASPSYW